MSDTVRGVAGWIEAIKELYGVVREFILIAIIVILALAMQGCRTVAALGDLTSAVGQDVRSLAESSEEAVKGYGAGL